MAFPSDTTQYNEFKHEQETKVDRTRVFYLSSDDQDATESVSNSEFTVYCKETIDSQQVKSICVQSVTVPNVFPNIHDSYGTPNTIFRWIEGGLDKEIIVPEGWYTAEELVAYFNANPAPASGAIFSFNINTQKISMDLQGDTGRAYIESEGSTMATALGFTVIGPIVNVSVGDSMVALQGLQNVFIESKTMAHSNGLDGNYGVTSILESVSLHDVPFGAFKTKNNESVALSEIDYHGKLRNLSRIDLRLVDSEGNTLPIGSQVISIAVKTWF